MDRLLCLGIIHGFAMHEQIIWKRQDEIVGWRILVRETSYLIGDKLQCGSKTLLAGAVLRDRAEIVLGNLFIPSVAKG